MTLVEKIVIATAIGLLTTILVFINHAVWAVGEMLDWRYVIGFATGMTLTILWFRFVRRLD